MDAKQDRAGGDGCSTLRIYLNALITFAYFACVNAYIPWYEPRRTTFGGSWSSNM